MTSLKIIVLSHISSSEELSKKYESLLKQERFNLQQLHAELLDKSMDHLAFAHAISSDFTNFFVKQIIAMQRELGD